MTSISPSSHVAIAGAGLLGRLLAWRLLRGGRRVSLFDAGDLDTPPAAAWTAAGMVAPQCETAVSEASIYAMGTFALAQWPKWLAELDAEALWHAKGSLVVAHPQDMAALNQFRRDLEHALGEQANLQALDHAGLHHLEPDLAPGLRQGLYLENEAHLDNRELLVRLLAEIRGLGGQCHAHCPVETAPGEIVTPGGRQRFDWVIDCRGTGARPRQPGLRGVRGETLHVRTSEVHLSRPVRLMHPRYQLYVVPKPGHRFVIGATQIESEDRSPMSLQSSLELGSALFTLSPAFAEARILEQGVNLRPAFHDNLPRVTQQPGLISANGLFRHGYLLAPAVASHVLARLEGDTQLPFRSILDVRPLQEVSP
ncbi:glycine oxidase [Modicisalibacter ilicicola DSM 19980]|uniref:Glycine oxidase n=1 Tax=Modicisalibacter ilicicola DSM 19980 TaxID=1121942 RepID=A0A1M4SHV3_9GAMM|nr:glycine oxidase ThiO [Halomonas ilicicola]SHE31728.1 glycine oxidase [Halomonas ilicicola DSM 19980]